MKAQEKSSSARHDTATGRFRGDLPDRTYQFAIMIGDVVDQLPSNTRGWEVAKQLFRSGTSVGANTAEANEALTDAEFAHRCSISRREASETRFWLRNCRDTGLVNPSLVHQALVEVEELIRILVTIIRRIQQSSRDRRAAP